MAGIYHVAISSFYFPCCWSVKKKSRPQFSCGPDGLGCLGWGLADNDFGGTVAAVADEIDAGAEVAGADFHLLLALGDRDALQGASLRVDHLELGGRGAVLELDGDVAVAVGHGGEDVEWQPLNSVDLLRLAVDAVPFVYRVTIIPDMQIASICYLV